MSSSGCCCPVAVDNKRLPTSCCRGTSTYCRYCRRLIVRERLLLLRTPMRERLLLSTPSARAAHLHQAFGVEQEVGRLDVAMEQTSRVHVLERFEQLIDNVLLVDILKDIAADRRVQVGLHELEDDIDIAVVLRLQHVGHDNNVLVTL